MVKQRVSYGPGPAPPQRSPLTPSFSVLTLYFPHKTQTRFPVKVLTTFLLLSQQLPSLIKAKQKE